MGKNLQYRDSSISEKFQPGCMRAIFHHLHQNQWHQVTKMLPLKRHIAGRRAAVKTRIKALFSEDACTRRGRHHRSSSYPEQMPLTRTKSIHRLDPAQLKISAELILKNETSAIVPQNTENSAVGSRNNLLLQKSFPEPISNAERFELCAALISLNAKVPRKSASVLESELFLESLDLLNMRRELFLKILQDPIASLAYHLQCQHAFSSKTVYSKSAWFPMYGASGSKVLLINPINKKRTGYLGHAENFQVNDKAKGFKDFKFSENAAQHSVSAIGESRDNGSAKPCFALCESHNNFSESASHQPKNRFDKKIVFKHFKNLRHKLKHVGRQNGMEKRRIIMDAIHHKIPYGCKSSKETKEVFHLCKEPAQRKCGRCSSGTVYSSDQSMAALRKDVLRYFRRTSSLDELLEICKEAKLHISAKSSSETRENFSPPKSSLKYRGRIRSLPDIRSYFYYRSVDSPSACSSDAPCRTILDSALHVEKSSQCSEHKPLDLPGGSENEYQIDAHTESKHHLSSAEQVHAVDDLVNSTIEESGFCNEYNSGPAACSAPVVEKLSPTRSLDSDFQENRASPSELFIEDSELQPKQIFSKEADCLTDQQHQMLLDSPTVICMDEVDRIEAITKQSCSDSSHVKVDVNDKAEFDYVRDVLRGSGFSENEVLSTWHSYDQPVDSSVFDKLEGCFPSQPDFSRHEVERCNHLLLFDLINEILVEIYCRSFIYCPIPLTCRSHIHPMPVGYHVLEEVWANISWYLSRRHGFGESLDDAVCFDLEKGDGWMNLQSDAEYIGFELEDMILDDLLDEFLWT